MTQPGSSESADRPRVWPRTPDGHCSCPYCTAIRDGDIEPIPDQGSEWLRRMGGVPK